MPVHDWTRVSAGTFHHFHQTWMPEICNSLNGGILPRPFYALVEQVAGRPHPDVLTLEAHEENGVSEHSTDGGTAVLAAAAPPRVRYTLEAEEAIYAAKSDRIAIRHASGDRVVAFLEIVSPGNKHNQTAVIQLLDKLSHALAHGCHLLVIDVHPPGKHDPAGLHAAFWSANGPTVTAEEPLSLAAYRAGPLPTAYFEPLAVGATLPDFPLFLTYEEYVKVPLETTYQAAWCGVPARWKRVIEG